MTPTLFDALTREQLYIEGAKAGIEDESKEDFDELSLLLLGLLGAVTLEKLNDLTKFEFERLIKRVRLKLTGHFAKYKEKLLSLLRKFMEADKFITRKIFAKLKPAPVGKTPLRQLYGPMANEATAEGDDRLWAVLMGSLLPTGSGSVLQFIDSFAATAILKIVNLFYFNRSNVETVQDLRTQLVGTKALKYKDGQVLKLFNQAGAVIGTIVQHAAQIVSSSISSMFFEQYQWSSIIDSVTTDICRSRDKKVYTYGNGPLPPAHVRCRSKTIPVAGELRVPANFFAWLVAQPVAVQNDIVGATKAQAIRAGRLGAKDFGRFNERTPLTIAEFRNKLDLMLTV